jgi:FG-GAP-like repeat/Abnormal spindle-like microcephaly-assoc'd, ASPM-SPD-2-Hydin
VNSSHQRTAQFRRGETASCRLANGLKLTLAAMIVLSLSVSALAQSAVPYLYGPLKPEQKSPGAATFVLTVYGTGFASGAVVNWNGQPLTTTFVTAEELTATVPAANVATAGTALVTVSNGGVISNTLYFQVVKAGYTVAYGKTDYATDTTANDITTTQFTTSGQMDLAVATGDNTVSILLGNGTGTFPSHVQYGVPGNPVAIAHGDFTGSGVQDLATADQYLSQISVLLGNGDGTFQTEVSYPTGAEPVAIAVGDVNGDGILDIVTANYHAGTVSVLLGVGNGTFQTNVDYPTGNGPMGVAIGDFNGDGKLDIVTANNTDGTVSILLNNGNGTFQAAVPYATAVNPTCVAVGNFVTGTDVLDLAVGTSNKLASVLLGNGNGTFQNHKDYAIGAGTAAIALADLNSSGVLAMITANENDNTISTLLGTGTGTFKTESVFPANIAPAGLAIGDYNDDGRLDIAASTVTGSTASVFLDSLITLSPSLLSFGVETSGFPTASKTITLKNTGTTPYTMGTISQVGTYSTDFTIPTNTCPAAGASLAAGASCTLGNVFDPTASEAANAQVLITSSNGSALGYQETGNGNVPIMMNPRTITFPGYTLIGSTSAAKITTFTNVSGVPVTFTSLVLSGTNQTEFSQTSTCPGVLGNAPGSLAPGASCTSNIYFTPTQSGGATVTEIYSGNFTVGRAGSLISAQGTAVKVSPTTLSFPNTTVGTSSAAKTVTFQNAGPTAMTISSVNIINGSGPNFSQTNTCQPSVPANSTCTFSVIFTPQTAGALTATLSIGDPDPTGPQQIKLSGTGVAAAGSAAGTQ